MQLCKFLLPVLCFLTIFSSCTLSTQSGDSSKQALIEMDSTAAVSWLTRPGNTRFIKSDNNAFYLYIKLRGNEILTSKKRVPLNISVVLDRSGSMQGDKIAFAKKAASFVVDQLNSGDILSLVNYDDNIEITSPSQPVKNKEILKKKIDELTDRGATNLTGGMLEGYNQAETTKKEGFVNRVLLLTDGLANQGITDPAQIKELVQKKYMEKGIALSTFGLGADYNEDLLTLLAETGRANYYFIDSPDKIPAIFAKELKGLLSVVAQNAMVQVTVPQGWQVQKVYGYPFEQTGSTVTVRFNDVYAEDEKGILVKFTAGRPPVESIDFNCSMQYTNATNFEKVQAAKKITLHAAADTASVNKNKDSLVEEMIALYESTETFEDILSDVDKGDYERAKVKTDSAIHVLQEKQRYLPSQKLKKQEENLRAYSKDMDNVKVMQDVDRKIYQKANKSVNYSVRKGKVL